MGWKRPQLPSPALESAASKDVLLDASLSRPASPCAASAYGRCVRSSFMMKIQELQRNPDSLSQHMSDPRILQVMGMLMGVNIQTPDAAGFGGGGSSGGSGHGAGSTLQLRCRHAEALGARCLLAGRCRRSHGKAAHPARCAFDQSGRTHRFSCR